jgi:adenylate cyclase
MRRLALLPALAVALAAGGLATLLYETGPLRRLELALYDARMTIARPALDTSRVVVVAIDPRTEEQLNVSFPFDRRLHARMIDRLSRAGVAVIAYDVEFDRPRTAAEDLALLDAIDRAHGKVVVATSAIGPGGRTQVLGGPALLREVGATAGDSSLLFDSDGVIRRLTFRPHVLPTFAEAAARRVGARPSPADYVREPDAIGAAAGDVRTTWMDFAGPPGSIRTYSFGDVLAGRVPAAALRGKVVVVGASDPAIGDVHRTAAPGADLMAGPEVQAGAIATTLAGAPLRSVPTWLNLALVWLLALVPALVAGRLSLRALLASSAALLVALLVGVQLAFAAGHVATVTYPLLALVLGTAGAFALRYTAELRARRRTRQLFTRFVPEEVVDAAERRRTDSDLRTPVRLDATVLFSDLRGFTTFSEKLPAETVSAVLNRYLATMGDAVAAEGGTVVSYMGDGIMAVFGAPAAADDHADRALAAARAMLARLDQFNSELHREGLGEGFRMGIGLNSGPVISGNVGSDRHLEYAAIGDTTNTAARLEAMTKDSGQSLLLSESTRRRLGQAPADLVRVGEVSIRGREDAVEVWALGAVSEVPG